MLKQKIDRKLRFSALIRVSTERQSKRGESLKIQEKQIREAIIRRDGILTEDCIYKGQEHSSPGNERKILDRLLKDASCGKFDAVIVADISRWGRDNKKCKEGLNILIENNIRFFDVSREYNLSDSQDWFHLGLFGEIHEFNARQTAEKSMYSRLERAKKGFPSFGRKPFGYCVIGSDENGHAIWKVIPECRKFLLKAVDLYINNNYGFEKVANILRNDPSWEKVTKVTALRKLHATSIADILINRSSKTEYVIEPKGNKYKKVTIKLPEPLLSNDDIKLVREKAKMNRVRMNRSYSGNYPLSGVLFCNSCGNCLTGLKNGEYRYYRHHHVDKKGPNCVRNIRADDIERAVLYEISLFINNTDNLEQALKNSFSETTVDMEELIAEKKNIKDILNKLEKERGYYIDSIGKNPMESVRVSLIDKAEKLDIEIESFHEELDDINRRLLASNRQIGADFVESLSKQLKKTLRRGYINALNPKERSNLFQCIIGGLTIQERKRLNIGIFVSDQYDDEADEHFKYIEIKGNLIGNVDAPITNFPYIGDKYYESKYKKFELLDMKKFISSLGIKNQVVPESELS